MATLREDAAVQTYSYTPFGQLAGYRQGNVTLQSTVYKAGQIEAQVLLFT